MGKAAGRNKIQRVLNLYNRLMEGDTLDKAEEALRFRVTISKRASSASGSSSCSAVRSQKSLPTE